MENLILFCLLLLFSCMEDEENNLTILAACVVVKPIEDLY